MLCRYVGPRHDGFAAGLDMKRSESDIGVVVGRCIRPDGVVTLDIERLLESRR